MPKDTKTLGNNKARAWESPGFVHKKGHAYILTRPLFRKKRVPVTGHAFTHSYRFGLYLLLVITMYKKSLANHSQAKHVHSPGAFGRSVTPCLDFS